VWEADRPKKRVMAESRGQASRGAVEETGVGEILRRCVVYYLCYFLLIFKRLKTG
jgi:hypothetical protein